MQGSIRNLKNKVQGLNLITLIDVVIDSTSYKLIELNQRQIYGGMDKDGELINPGYALFTYALNKYYANPLPQFKKAPLGTSDLFLTGAFFSKFTAKIDSPGKVLLDSTDEKTAELKRKYGSIFGIMPINLKIYVKQSFLPDFQEGFTAATGLRFGV